MAITSSTQEMEETTATAIGTEWGGREVPGGALRAEGMTKQGGRRTGVSKRGSSVVAGGKASACTREIRKCSASLQPRRPTHAHTHLSDTHTVTVAPLDKSKKGC